MPSVVSLLALSTLSLSICAQKLWLMGDSLTAVSTRGWGTNIGALLDIPVDNQAVPGSSYHTTTDNGLFDEIASRVQPGDFVSLEFGRNDFSNTTEHHGDCDAAGTCGQVETYHEYAIKTIKLFQQAKAQVIISGPLPMNLWNNPAGVFDFQHSLFTARAKAAAYETGAYFVDHEAAAAALQKVLGEAGTRLNWIGDNIHLTDRGSINVAGAYARAVICADAPLMLHIKTDRSKLPRYCSPDQVPAQTSRAGKRARFY